jgi:hypothetical protein
MDFVQTALPKITASFRNARPHSRASFRELLDDRLRGRAATRTFIPPPFARLSSSTLTRSLLQESRSLLLEVFQHRRLVSLRCMSSLPSNDVTLRYLRRASCGRPRIVDRHYEYAYSERYRRNQTEAPIGCGPYAHPWVLSSQMHYGPAVGYHHLYGSSLAFGILATLGKSRKYMFQQMGTFTQHNLRSECLHENSAFQADICAALAEVIQLHALLAPA